MKITKSLFVVHVKHDETEISGSLFRKTNIFLAPPENGTVISLTCDVPDWYLDFNDAPYLTAIEATCTINRYGFLQED